MREGTALPPAPPTPAEAAAGHEQRTRDVQAATDALLGLGDDICEAVRQHPEFEEQARADVAALLAEAEEMRRRAAEAERQAAAARIYVLWLERVAADELFVITLP